MLTARGWFALLLLAPALGGCARTVPGPPGQEDVHGLQRVVNHVAGGARLVIDRYGTPPLLAGLRCVKGNGIYVQLYTRGGEGPAYTLDVGEIDEPVTVDYSAMASGRIRITYWTWDPRVSEFEVEGAMVPFVVETVTIDRAGAAKTEQHVVLEPEEANPGRIGELANDFLTSLEDDEAPTERWERPLALLRDMAPSDPDAVFKALKGLLGKKKVGGAVALRVAFYIEQVDRVKCILEKERKPGGGHRAAPAT